MKTNWNYKELYTITKQDLFTSDGRYFNIELALIFLLIKEKVVFLHDKIQLITTGIFEDECGSGELIEMTNNDIEELMKPYFQYNETYFVEYLFNFAIGKFCCLKLKCQPRKFVKQNWIDYGLWDETLNQLPENKVI